MKIVNKCEVVFLDKMGDELTIVNAARVSFDKKSSYEFVQTEHPDYVDVRLKDTDVRLIKYLAKHNHWTPFGHVSLQFRVKTPIFVARQLVKHQIGLVWNEVSRRYVDDEPEFYWPDQWRRRNPDKKQGSYEDEFVDLDKISHYSDYDAGNIALSDCLSNHYENTISMYNKMLDSDVAPEQARMILPQNMMTEWYWSGSLMAFARICQLRLKPDAQKETREVAKKFDESIRPLFPNAWPALLGE